MRVERHRIPAGEWVSAKSEGELFVHPLVGFGEANGQPFGGRRNIFHPFPGGLLFDRDVEIKATTDLDVIVATAETPYPGAPASVSAKLHTIGQGTAKREVREILGADGPSEVLRCGETVNKPGGWSSWPPHHFDADDGGVMAATGFREVFYVFTDPKDSYALVRRKGWVGEGPIERPNVRHVDDVVLVRSGERVDVPLGEHPIVGAPGTKVIYLWFYVGVEELYAKWAEDMGAYRSRG